MYYHVNKLNSVTRSTKPSLADQAGAQETDINVIVRRFGITGGAPGTTRAPMYGDFTEMPKDLRGFIELGQTLTEQQSKLPEQLRDIPLDQLVTLTPEQLRTILTPATTAETPKEGT